MLHLQLGPNKYTFCCTLPATRLCDFSSYVAHTAMLESANYLSGWIELITICL